jgi:L-aspartate oxidase
VQHHAASVLVIGGGVAGLTAALHAAEATDVTLLSRDPLLEVNSAHAQGGIAVVLDITDTPLQHIEDTLVAGAGLSDLEAVETLVRESPVLMHDLARAGVPFDREDDRFVLGLEGGHSHRRILHVGDKTGQALMQALIRRARAHPHLHILEGYQAVDLLDAYGRCSGALALDSSGSYHAFSAGATILAMGGAGALYGLTSNQPGALGEGIALAYRLGAEVADMEFVQFHPTVLRTRAGQGFLISEAARGEGGRLLTPAGLRFMPDNDPRGELAPRDIVTRGIVRAMQQEQCDYVLLDLMHLSRHYLQRRFPTIYRRCCAEGIDPSTTPIPVAPAAHYLMGGIRTDLDQATSIPGLYAAGECACTGVHGANRLASNSLLECLVSGRRAGRAALACTSEPLSRAVGDAWYAAPAAHRALARVAPRPTRTVEQAPAASLAHLAEIMRTFGGPLRSGSGLAEALAALEQFPLQCGSNDPHAITLANAALTARLIIASALARQESRGAHFRHDFPATDATWQVHLVLQREQPPRTVETVAQVAVPVRVERAAAGRNQPPVCSPGAPALQ